MNDQRPRRCKYVVKELLRSCPKVQRNMAWESRDSVLDMCWHYLQMIYCIYTSMLIIHNTFNIIWYKTCKKLLYNLISNTYTIPVVPHKAVAEVSKIGNLQERLVVVNRGWQSEATDGLKGAWGLSSLSLSFSLFPSVSLSSSDYLSAYLLIYLSTYLSVCLSVYVSPYLSVSLSTYLFSCLSIPLSMYLSTYLSIYLSIYLSTYLPIYLSTYLPIYLSIYLSIYIFPESVWAQGSSNSGGL